MAVFNDFMKNFNSKRIDIPEYAKLLFLLKNEFTLEGITAKELLKKIRQKNDQSADIMRFAYNKIKQHVDLCKNCPLHLSESNTQKVMGEGALNSPLILVGEGPGFEEDKLGRPFVGRAGKLLDSILKNLGVRRNKIYITNVIKCRPPRNRTPNRNEITACGKNLELELKFIAPKVIILLGATPLNYFNSGNGIIQSRGKWIFKNGYWIMPTFHPAYILRQHGKNLKKVKWQVWGDFNKALDKVNDLVPNCNLS